MVCRNICQTIHTKIEVGEEMRLRLSPARKWDKERLRKCRQKRRSKITIAT